ncbi:MAG: 5-(carboxyamino)imidazole ribonucleotide synthase [Hyphomicrobiales bacterium]
MMAPLSPGSRIGILGGGQLGAMLAGAAGEMGFEPHIYAPESNSPAFQRCGTFTCKPYEDLESLARFAKSVDVLSYEFENVPIEPLRHIEKLVPIRPGISALETAQDRLIEKRFLQKVGVPLAQFRAVDSSDHLVRSVQELGLPCVLKTRRFGYDGKGQIILRSASDVPNAFEALGGNPCVLEAFVPFFAETSVIAARGLDGQVASYEMALNHHENHILKTTRLPSGLPPGILTEATIAAEAILRELDYVGVMGIEFFVSGTPKQPALLVNEIAPRVHNSGHWTQDGALIDQFEQHIRAIAGWPLGDGKHHSNVVMTNLIGSDMDGWQGFAADPFSRVHLYGKGETRPGRKMGHVNTVSAKP